MSIGAIKAGEAFVRVFADDQTDKGLAAAKKNLKDFANQVGAIGVALTAAAAAGLAGIGAAVKIFATIGSDLNDMSQRTGVSASKLAELGYAAEQSGASLGAVEMALRTMAKKGFNVNDFDRIAKSIAAIPDPSERAAKAMEVFGKSGTKLLPMIQDLEKWAKDAKWLGIIPSDADIKKADDLGDAFTRTKAAIKGTIMQVGAAMAPAMEALSNATSEVIGFFNRFAEKNRGLVTILATATTAVLGMGLAIGALGIAIKGISIAYGILGTIQTGYAIATAALTTANLALGASWITAIGPLGVVIGLVAALIPLTAALAAIIINELSGGWLFRTLYLRFLELNDIVIKTFSGIFNALTGGQWELAGNIAMAGLKAAWATGLLAVMEMTTTFVQWAQHKLASAFGASFAARTFLDLATGVAGDTFTGQARNEQRKAIAELDRLNKQAKDIFGDKTERAAPPTGTPNFGVSIPKSIQTTIRETDKAVSSGAFSGFAAMHLSRNKPEVEIQERIVTELKEQTVLLKDLVENTEEGGAEFGE